MATQTLRSVIRDGVTLRYTDSGAGSPPLVFVHGWTCNLTNWRDQVPHYEARHRVVALDQRGHGASDKPDQDYTIEGFVDDLAWFIGELGLVHPVVIGHSMGGSIALNFVHRHPELARAIVMIDSPIGPLATDMRGMADSILAGMKSPGYASIVEGFARMQFFNSDTPAALVDELVPAILSAPQRIMHTAMSSILEESSRPAGAIPVPALFIRAATSYKTEEDFRARYPGLEVHTLDCAHFVQMEKPTETNALIDAFLGSLT